MVLRGFATNAKKVVSVVGVAKCSRHYVDVSSKGPTLWAILFDVL
ncbi:MAG: hypothetical protein QXQ31_03855 [Zestosphaera sp.]